MIQRCGSISFFSSIPYPLMDESKGGSSRSFRDTIQRDLSSFGLCGRAWDRLPESIPELMFNTFRPVFCEERSDENLLDQVLSAIDWYVIQSDSHQALNLSSVNEDRQIDLTDLPNRMRPGALVICSDQIRQIMIGMSLKRWYHLHSSRDDGIGERAPFLLADLRLPSGSILNAVSPEKRRDLEMIILPDPGSPDDRRIWGPREKNRERFEELRLDYIRRVHTILGCGKHYSW